MKKVYIFLIIIFFSKNLFSAQKSHITEKERQKKVCLLKEAYGQVRSEFISSPESPWWQLLPREKELRVQVKILFPPPHDSWNEWCNIMLDSRYWYDGKRSELLDESKHNVRVGFEKKYSEHEVKVVQKDVVKEERDVKKLDEEKNFSNDRKLEAVDQNLDSALPKNLKSYFAEPFQEEYFELHPVTSLSRTRLSACSSFESWGRKHVRKIAGGTLCLAMMHFLLLKSSVETEMFFY